MRPYPYQMLVFRFTADTTLPDGTRARPGDELCVTPQDPQFPAVLRRVLALDDVAHVMGDCHHCDLIYVRPASSDGASGVPIPGGSAAPPPARHHLRLLREGA